MRLDRRESALRAFAAAERNLMARTTRLQATRRAAASSGDGGTATASARPGHLPASLATTIPDNKRSLMDLRGKCRL